MRPARLPIRNRFVVLTTLAIGGLLAYVPALHETVRPSTDVVFALPLAAGAVVAALAVLGGLRWADAAALPMPWLRRLDGVVEARPGRAHLALLAGASLVFGAAVVVFLRAAGIENLRVSLPSRLLTTAFAAVTLEVVVHLAGMSAAVRFTRSIPIGVALSTALFVVFHASGAIGEPLPVAAAVVLLNGAFGALLGVAYARLGFEAVVLGHAVAHAIAISFG